MLPHPLLVLQPPGLGWGWARCRAGVCGSAAQPTSSSPDGAASVFILGETHPRASIWFDLCFFSRKLGAAGLGRTLSRTDLLGCDEGLQMLMRWMLLPAPPAASPSAFGIGSGLEPEAGRSRGSIWRLPPSPDPN